MSTKKYVQTTENYDQFEIDERQRVIKSPNLRKLKKSMERYGWLSAYPMHVTKVGSKYKVYDGQHRLAAAKALGIPVKFIVEKADITPSEINAAQSAWGVSDYVESFIRAGNQHYVELKKYHLSSRIPYGIAASLLMAQQKSDGVTSEKVKSGAFRVSAEGRRVGGVVGQIVALLRSMVPWGSNKSCVHALCLCARLDDFDPTRLTDKIRTNPGMLIKQPDTTTYLQLFEKLYNYKARSKTPLAFNAKEKGSE